MSSARVRGLRADDVARVLAINEANVPEVGGLDLDRLDFLLAESAIALVVESGDTPIHNDIHNDRHADMHDGVHERPEIAGFCLVLAPGSTYESLNYRWFMDRYDDAMYLDRVAFDARFQGAGLGTLLYSEVVRIIAAEHPGANRLTLEVNVDPPNEPSLAFHSKLGFVEVGRQVSKGIEVSLMSKPLP